MKTQPVAFANAQGQRIAARLDRPDGEPIATAVFAHCFTCSKELKPINWISKRLADRGIAVLRFDFTGLGESEGKFEETNFSSNLEDLVLAADYLRSELMAPELLIGHSLGGTAVLAGAQRIPESKAVATIAAPSATQHIREKLLRENPDLTEKGEAVVQFGSRGVKITKQFLDDLDEHKVHEAIATLGRGLLVLHSPIDKTVDISHAHDIFDTARHPKSFVSLDDTDHLMLEHEQDSHYIADVLVAWSKRYLKQLED